MNDESKTVKSAAMKEEISQDEDEEMFGAEEARHYMSLDRSDVQYAAKEVCRKMTNPTPGSWNRLQKVGMYVKRMEEVTSARQAWKHDDERKVYVHVDSDWAKGPKENRQTERMMVVMIINGTAVKRWSRTQATRALSTAEAVYYQGLGMQSMMKDLGLSAQVRVWTDSNADSAIASRTGLGKPDTWS